MIIAADPEIFLRDGRIVDPVTLGDGLTDPVAWARRNED
jgi:hypothetical protein